MTITEFKRLTTTQIKAQLPITVTSSGSVLFKAAGGFYCALIDAKLYKSHHFEPFDKQGTNGLSCDVTKPYWLGGWNNDIWSDVNTVAKQGKTSLFVIYNIPGRDNGSYSAGGLQSPQAYYDWVGKIADAIGTTKAICVLEPDALGLSRSLSEQQKSERYAMLNGAIKSLKAKPNTKVYVDSSIWAGDDSGGLLGKLSGMDGFSVNVSGYDSLLECNIYGDKVSRATGLKYIVDTSRNGNGNPYPGKWCNVTDTKIGLPNQLNPTANCDAYLWIKVPGESDGLGINDDGSNPRSDVPRAGELFPDYKTAIYSGDWAAFKTKYRV